MDQRTWALIGIVLSGCGVTYPDSNRPNYTSYAFHHTYTTNLGIQVDDPKHELDVGSLDKTIVNVENCLAEIKPLTDDEKVTYLCYGDNPVYSIKYELNVQVPDDWYISDCSGKEVFPCTVPDASCEAKGLTPTNSCPCSCRAMIQDNTTIITAPNLELFPAQLVQLLTGCAQIWHGGRLQRCGEPDMVIK